MLQRTGDGAAGAEFCGEKVEMHTEPALLEFLRDKDL